MFKYLCSSPPSPPSPVSSEEAEAAAEAQRRAEIARVKAAKQPGGPGAEVAEEPGSSRRRSGRTPGEAPGARGHWMFDVWRFLLRGDSATFSCFCFFPHVLRPAVEQWVNLRFL